MDAEQLAHIYENNYKRVYNYISYRINNHHNTEDMVSTVFEKVVMCYDAYRPGSSPLESWIITIAKNVVADYFRGIKRGHNIFSPLDSAVELIFPAKQPDEICVLQEENRQLIQALNKLSEKERNLVAMKYAGDLKNNEIARIMSMSESNVGVVLHRALRKMRKFLEKEELSYGLGKTVADRF